MALDHSGTNNCVVQLLTSIQNTFGPITNISYITNLVKTVKASGLPSNITCTDCVKEAYNLANKSLPTVVAELGPPLQSQCGASFIGKALSNASIKTQRTDFLGS